MFADGKQKVAEKQWRQKEAKASKYGFMPGAVPLWEKGASSGGDQATRPLAF